jgi:branched-subunit amino acid aminotransferase/4-amino-4-deoxychorismate lyase
MMDIFWNGQYTSMDEIGIHPNDRGFLLGDGVYEVVRIYAGGALKCLPTNSV